MGIGGIVHMKLGQQGVGGGDQGVPLKISNILKLIL